ncbi:MAG TPA: efflux RND transporter periplasmic adaptor subunit [Cyclobacteriaceae bacterium]|nr:efflux RND transporter periplasmic adaptor subunit [Cyclobacteriaceae bacterium]
MVFSLFHAISPALQPSAILFETKGVFTLFRTNFAPQKLRFMHWVRIIALFLMVGSGLISGCKKQDSGSAASQRARGPLMVEGFIVQPSAVSEDVEVSGTLLPLETTTIKAEVSGRITQLNFNEGSIVPQGFLLVKLFDQDLQAQLRKLQVQLQIAIKTVQRQRELLAINGISQQDFDLSALNVDNLKADIQTTHIAISKTEIRAPYEGQIGLRNVSMGAYLSPQDIITTLRDVKKLKLEFSVPEKYAKNIGKGYTIKFKVDGGRKTHEAVVLATEGNVDQNTRTLKIRAIVSNNDAELVPGIFAKVNLQMGQDSMALMVPTQAIIPQARNKSLIVFHKDSAQFTVVETGLRDSAYIQILRGIHAHDTIVTTGLMAVRPGVKIKLVKVKRLK